MELQCSRRTRWVRNNYYDQELEVLFLALNFRVRLVAELRSGLLAKGLYPPYLFVGWSYGGLLAQVYHVGHPHELAGVVLVDTSYPYALLTPTIN